MFDTRAFGQNMQAKRKDANLTQQGLAEKVGLTRQAISKYETGESFPDISIVIHLAQVFGTSIDELVDPDGVTALLYPAARERFLQRLLDGEIDLHQLEAALPYLEDMGQQLEAAVFEGALPHCVSDMLNAYWITKNGG